LDQGEESTPLDVAVLARSPRGDDASVRFILGELARIDEAVEEAQARKGHALSAISEPGFWERDDRFGLLAEAEYLDRLNAAAKTGRRLGDRLRRSVRPDGRANAELVGLLAGRIYVLDRALAGLASDAPTEVFVHLRPSGISGGESGESAQFASTLSGMYVAWADRRGMQVERVDAPDGQLVLVVSGLGCGEILRAESGLHVLEHVDGDRDGSPVVDRDQVQVVVVARPPGEERSTADVEREAAAALKNAETPSVVVRRYRPGKSPLVRDSVRGYRTGRLDRVLAGDFDLY
jgi:ATP-dependent Clp protease ATP-binding subunit ClpC